VLAYHAQALGLISSARGGKKREGKKEGIDNWADSPESETYYSKY
jgi:hypothetical protein